MYPRMDQVKFMEDSLMVEDSDKVYLLISIPPTETIRKPTVFWLF